MGSFNSVIRGRRRSDMDDADTESPGPDSGSQSPSVIGPLPEEEDHHEPEDIATLLSYLIRSGQVRILQSSGLYGDDVDMDDEDDDDEDCLRPSLTPKGDPNPDTSCLDENQLRQQILLDSGRYPCKRKRPGIQTALPICNLLQQREVGVCKQQTFSPGDCRNVNSNFLPNFKREVARYSQKAFCGTHSQDGDIFLSACQDRRIRIYDTCRGQFKLFKTLVARDVGWSVLDTAFSPDRNYLIYSSWSDCVHLCNIHGDHETHDALPLAPEFGHSFCVFSVCFSQDNLEILGGANDGCLYVYDRDKNERSLRIDAHEDDVNAVAFADASSQIVFSGSDDGLCKVWDRRTLKEEHPVPVGALAGHTDGITFIDSKGDGRYLISNSKDQSIKLWDMRKFSSKDAQRATKQAVAQQKWDYRWQQVPGKVVRAPQRVQGDSCLMTYRGHSVLNTLLRCRFSPQYTTGQQYIYTGCASGAVVVYDILTGKVVTRLKGHHSCVRDVSWHPFDNKIVSTSWDYTVGEWTYFHSSSSDTEGTDTDSDDDDIADPENGEQSGRRRSARLRERKRRQRSGQRGTSARHFAWD